MVTLKSLAVGEEIRILTSTVQLLSLLVMLKYMSLTQISPLRFKSTCLVACDISTQMLHWQLAFNFSKLNLFPPGSPLCLSYFLPF